MGMFYPYTFRLSYFRCFLFTLCHCVSSSLIPYGDQLTDVKSMGTRTRGKIPKIIAAGVHRDVSGDKKKTDANIRLSPQKGAYVLYFVSAFFAAALSRFFFLSNSCCLFSRRAASSSLFLALYSFSHSIWANTCPLAHDESRP